MHRVVGVRTIETTSTPPHATELFASEQRFHHLVEAVTDYAIFMLDATGHVATWNAGAQNAKGYTPDEIIGKRFDVFYTPEDRAAGKPDRILDEVRRTGRYEEEGWRVRKDGSRFWANVVITALRDPTEKISSRTGSRRRGATPLPHVLINAVRFTPRGGRITVTGDRRASAIILRVTDTGAGISPANLRVIFERFRQLDSSTTRVHGGLGLGLAIVRHLVARRVRPPKSCRQRIQPRSMSP